MSPENLENISNFEGWDLTLVAYKKKVYRYRKNFNQNSHYKKNLFSKFSNIPNHKDNQYLIYSNVGVIVKTTSIKLLNNIISYLTFFASVQKQSWKVFYKKLFLKIHRKTPLLESFINKVANFKEFLKHLSIELLWTSGSFLVEQLRTAASISI